jgi:hypothetical protein
MKGSSTPSSGCDFGGVKEARVWAGLLLASLVCGVLSAHDSPPLPRELRLRALLNEGQVVRPDEFQPPIFGSGSAASGEAELVVNTSTGEFTISIRVRGLDPASLVDSGGPNGTAIQVRQGNGDEHGEILIDAHQLAILKRPTTNGLAAADDEFLLEAQGVIDEPQGAFTPSWQAFEIIDFLRSEQAYVSVHTATNSLFRFGEIRGNFEFVPRRLRLKAALDASQVVRPPELQPPLHGTNSGSSGELELVLDSTTGYFRAELTVDGIDPAQLDRSHGPNLSAVLLYAGTPTTRGAILLDLGDYAGRAPQGITRTDSGFHLRTEGSFGSIQGELDTARGLAELVDLLRVEETYVAVHTMDSDLFRQGEIRGNLTPAAATVQFVATLDGAQVVRPPAFQPPSHGTESLATGEAEISIEKESGRFRFRLHVKGIEREALFDGVGQNGTAIAIRWGTPDLRGPTILDVHHFARQLSPDTNGLLSAAEGFLVEAEGHITRKQGAHDTGFSFERILDFFRSHETYVSIATNEKMLFLAGEIRGNLTLAPESVPPEEVTFDVRLDERQVVVPAQLRPPQFGSGSLSTGNLKLSVFPRDSFFVAEMVVDGILREQLEESHGGNLTAVHIHRGDPTTAGPIILDLQMFANRDIPAVDFLEETASGFDFRAEGRIDESQGRHTTGLSRHEIIDLMLAEDAYVCVHSNKSELFVWGEIRGNLGAAPIPVRFLRGDCDGDGRTAGEVTDAVFLLNHSFGGGAVPPCLAACDGDGDGLVTGQVTDAVFLLTFSFLGGPPPPAPFPTCGPSTLSSDQGLGCVSPPACR